MSPVALLLCILFFPLGILFLICLTQKYWVLYPAGKQTILETYTHLGGMCRRAFARLPLKRWTTVSGSLQRFQTKNATLVEFQQAFGKTNVLGL